ncbi:hypothetical protein A1OK_11970 [Enterovibrio norvegicus FF-454]|uniref:Uncharacterized protein n=1 Tax=Enterovibrio norvegicus FF-454 TaxID=1185651 RepID=A0A1E5C3W6_9GAMM|nr:hypothetical protein [Enterovibrio norvegicus]OEE60194.1 hypothetical protein A1OK_11970 [Enterovibrio norvegicus FF-454]
MRHQNNLDLQLWLREAKFLQKAAQSDSLAQSLPVLRRLLESKIFTDITLPELKRHSASIQRKHLLHMLAAENGWSCWADFKKIVSAAPKGTLLPYSTERLDAGYLVQWFSSVSEAQRYTEQHSGKVVKVGSQAAVVPEQ